MKPTLEEQWLRIQQYLDAVLDLEPSARQAWLDELKQRDPTAAAQVATYLGDLAQLDQQDFLGDASFGMPQAQASLAGQVFGAYTLERPLGHGGMGTVWLANRTDGRFEGQVAVKLLNTALVGHPAEQRFIREGTVLAKLQHPNIAHLLDAGVAPGGQPYLVLEYVAGERIDRYCERRELSLKARVRLFLDVLAAVAHAHSNLVVHRDLKPSNILVSDRGVVKLLDFGVAALLASGNDTEGTSLTGHMAPGLTAEYAAPEQWLGGTITTATDVYALGLVLCVLLTGQHPASPEGKTAAELMHMTLDHEVPRASEIATDLSRQRLLRGDLDNIIAVAVRKNPAERYRTAELLAQDLRRYLALEPVTARAPSLSYRFAKFVRRHRLAVATAAGVALVLIGAVAVTSREMLVARQQRDHAQFQTTRAEAISDFLTLLMLSDLGGSRVPATLNERIELGVQLVKQQYRDDPRFIARMLLYLSNGFRDNNETRRANELTDEALALAREQQDPELMAFAQCQRVYGDAGAGIREGVMQRLQDAERQIARMSLPDPEIEAGCLMAKARAQFPDDDEAAEASLRKAQRVLEASGDTHRQDYLSVLSELSFIYASRGQPRELLRISQLIREQHERNGRGGSSASVAARQNAATALNSMGEPRAALAERVIINERMVALEGQPTARMLINYAVVLLRMAQPQAALQAMDGIVARTRSAGNPADLTLALTATSLTYIELGRWDEAQAALDEAAAALADPNSARNARANLEMLRARLALGRGDLPEAHRHRDLALELAGFGTEKQEGILPRVLATASRVALADKSAAELERFARAALALGESNARGPDTSADVGEALLRLAQAQDLQGKRGEMRALLERAVRCLTNGMGEQHPITLEAQQLLARVSK